MNVIDKKRGDGTPDLPGPHVDAGHLETIVPRSRVRSLALRAGAHAVPVRLSVLPATTVRAAIVEVKPAAVYQYLVGGGRAGGRRRRRRVVGQLGLVVLLQQHLLLLLLLLLCSVPIGRCRCGRRRHATRLHGRGRVLRTTLRPTTSENAAGGPPHRRRRHRRSGRRAATTSNAAADVVCDAGQPNIRLGPVPVMR